MRIIKGIIKDTKANIGSFIISVKQLVYWFPVIWKNRWWDYEYMLDLMKHQLEYMLKHWVKDTHHIGDEDIKLEMESMLDSLNKVSNFNSIPSHEEILKDIGKDLDKILKWWD